MRYLLDTCVISDLMNKTPHPQVVEWIDSQDDDRIYLSVITIGEIQKGIARLPDSRRKTSLREWLQDDLLVRFANRILAIDTAVMVRWGNLSAELQAKGRILPAMDSMIAAICLEHDMTLVTRNEKDFAGTGVKMINPWNSN